MTHWAAAVIPITTAICLKMANTPSKSTPPFLTIRSITRPVRIGRYRVNVTVSAAITIDNAR